MRIRSIKPEFWRSQDVADLPRDIRLLWIGLWSYVDDNGVGIDDFRQIAADLFALEDDPMEAREFVREGLATLSRGLRLTRYTVDGVSYIHITNWEKHQRVDRPNKERYPKPPKGTPPGDQRKTAGHERTNGAKQDTLATPSRDIRETPSTGTEEQGNRGTEEGTPEGVPRARARTRGGRSTDPNLTHAELANTAHGPTAHQLVTTWHTRIGNPYRSSTVRALARHAEELITEKGKSNEVQAAINDALALFHDPKTEARTPKALLWLYDRAVSNRAAARDPNPEQPHLKAVSGGYRPFKSNYDPNAWTQDAWERAIQQ